MSMPCLPTDWWPVAQVGRVLDYTFDVARDLRPVSDVIETVRVSAKPSGEGELTINSVEVVLPYEIGVNLSGGVAGRLYMVNIEVTTAAGRTFSYLVGMPMSSILTQYPIPPEPDPGFGPPVTWPTAGAGA